MTSQIDLSNLGEKREKKMLRNICASVLGSLILVGSFTPGAMAATAASEVPTFADVMVQQKVPDTATPKMENKKQEKAAPAAPAAANMEDLRISINLAARSLAVFAGEEKIRLYPIGPGTAYTPTPTGYYKIRSKDVNPSWINPENGDVIPSGPSCPLGYRWMELQGNYGIHGTNKPESIGHYVSNGCIRMLESDVEALFDLVKIGTPVEITYNRVVVEKLADNNVVYYIYPDGYGWQNISVADVNKWLAGYGVSGFVTNDEIEAKINASDGEPTYVGQVYPLFVNGVKMKNKAVIKNGVTYLPAIDLADATHIDLGWNNKTQKLISTVGVADGFDKKDVLYCKLDGAAALFKLTGQVENGSFILKNMPQAVENKQQPADNKAEKPAGKVVTDPVAQEMSQNKKSVQADSQAQVIKQDSRKQTTK